MPSHQYLLSPWSRTDTYVMTIFIIALMRTHASGLVIKSSYLCPQPGKIIACKKVKIATGISNIEADDIEIYPNPADGQLTVRGPIEGSLIQIFDVVGREIYNSFVQQNTSSITTKTWPDGTYILQLFYKGGGIIHKKIVVSR